MNPTLRDTLLKRQAANILKKSQRGGVLTEREEKILEDYQESKEPQPKIKKTRIKGKTGLAQRTGFTRKTFDSWSKFPDFPKPQANGDYFLEDVVEWIRVKGVRGGELPEIQKLKHRELVARCEKLEFELEIEKEKYVLIEKAEREITQSNLETKNFLQFKFGNELPPDLVGCSIAIIQTKCKAAIQEVCEKLSREI